MPRRPQQRAYYFQRLGQAFKMANQLQLQPWRCFMSYKALQLLPPASTRVTGPFLPSEDMGFLQSWFKGGSIREGSTEQRHLNWGAVAGIAISVAFSASFWAGVVWIVARILR
jgi:hypothetical protein